MRLKGTKKRRVAKRPRAGATRDAASKAGGNRRRHPRRGSADGTPRVAKRTGAPKEPPTRGRRIAAASGRWALRLGVAGGVAYAVLWGAQEGYDYATTSPRFEVRGLVFEPTPHVSDTRLRTLMGIEPGTNILALDLDQLAKDIASEPWVARASVTRVLPDSLDVEVEEHEPVAVLLAGGFFLLSDEGLPFKPLEDGERGQLPVITGLGRAEVLTKSSDAQARIARAIETISAYAEKRRPRLSEINIDETGALTLYTAELGSQLRVGRGDIPDALARFDALRAALGVESDKLAVAHLDAAEGQSSERVIASFFPTKQAPSFVADASRRASNRAEKHAELMATAQEHKERARGATQGKKKSRLPKYE